MNLLFNGFEGSNEEKMVIASAIMPECKGSTSTSNFYGQLLDY